MRPPCRALLALIAILWAGSALATWRPEYGDSDPAWLKWFTDARLTAEASRRLTWMHCCSHADRFKTQFRQEKVGGQFHDAWFYLQDEEWKRIPDDVIHREPDPTMPVQLKTEGVLFIYPPVNGVPTCFWPPESGG